MKHHRLKLLLTGLLLSTFIMDAGTQASAYSPAVTGKHDDLFANEEPLKNQDLDHMRGGFIASNGMIIDFTFSANTLVDGQLINQIILDTKNLIPDADSLRRIIQLGTGNQAFNNQGNNNPAHNGASDVGIEIPDINVEIPDTNVDIPDVNVEIPDVNIEIPDVNVEIPVVNMNMGTVPNMNMDALPNVLTVVQNSLDNLTIQQMNLLDLTVQNMNNFIRQSVNPEIDFQNSLGLAP